MELYLQKISLEEFKALLKETLNDILSEKGYEIRERSETMTIQEASQMLNMKIKTIYAKTSQRLVPHYKRGRNLTFKRSELQAWLDGGRVATMKEIQRNLVVQASTPKK